MARRPFFSLGWQRVRERRGGSRVRWPLIPAAVTNEQKIDPNDAKYDPATGLDQVHRVSEKTPRSAGRLRLLAALCKKNIVPAPGSKAR